MEDDVTEQDCDSREMEPQDRDLFGDPVPRCPFCCSRGGHSENCPTVETTTYWGD